MSHPPRVGCRCSPQCRAVRAQYEKERRYYAHRGQPLTIPAVGFKRRVRALAALGWTQRQIAAELGIAPGNLSNRMRYTDTVTRRMHETMCAIYDRLSMTLPPDEMANRRTRTMARSKGWPPPLAWDDDHIDDPTYRPSTARASRRTEIVTSKDIDEAVVYRVLNGENLPATRAEKHEIMRRWIAGGGSEASLCKRMGWKPGRYVVGISHAEDDRSTDRKAS